MNIMHFFESHLQAGSLLAFPAAFAGGLLASLTPCVYPLIPVTIAFIGSRAATTGRSGVQLSLAYAAGIALVYALLGGVAALSGRLFGLVSAHSLTNAAVGVALLVMALCLLEVVPLPCGVFFPGSWTQKRGTLAGSFTFGLCSGLVMSPCTTPVTGALLLYVAAGQHVLFGMSLLFAFACGMCTILICIGSVTGLAARLPKSGPWMIAVKRGLAILMACAGAYFIWQAVTAFF